MAKHKINVVLIESGDFEFDEKTQSLYGGFSTGREYSVSKTRARFLGGTTNWWGSMCGPFHEIDFEPKEYCSNYDGWPIQRSELDKYYQKAHHYLDLGDYDYSIEKCREYSKTNKKGILEGSNNIETLMFQGSRPTNYRLKFGEKLSKSKYIRVFTNFNVINIATSGKDVIHVDAVTLNGLAVKFKGTNFVVAMGGIETPRLLLNSDNKNKNGVGNKNDLVGRFFMEHPHSECVELHLNPDVTIDDYLHLGEGTWLPNKISEKPISMWPIFTINPSKIKDRKILNASFSAFGNISKNNYYEFSDNRVIVEVTESMKKHFNSTNDNDLVIKTGIICRAEQAPNPNSRITLSNERDFLGQRKVILNWELLKIDIDTIFESLYIINYELIKKKIGRLRLNCDKEFNIYGAHHHMGTTRMHDNEKFGVVDSNLKVHELNNLYIASSSVFPTSGFVNPTLTIVALSIRLSEYLIKNKYSENLVSKTD